MRFELAKLILGGTRKTYQAIGDAGLEYVVDGYRTLAEELAVTSMDAKILWSHASTVTPCTQYQGTYEPGSTAVVQLLCLPTRCFDTALPEQITCAS